LLSVPCSTRAAGPEGQLTWAVHVTLAPTWFDPAETSGIITPYMMLYAVHDAMVKPMPGNSLAPSLAESVTISDDKLTYDMTIRKGAAPQSPPRTLNSPSSAIAVPKRRRSRVASPRLKRQIPVACVSS
jgi:ABC-type oligopeptide transport system substrate-binding subunit